MASSGVYFDIPGFKQLGAAARPEAKADAASTAGHHNAGAAAARRAEREEDEALQRQLLASLPALTPAAAAAAAAGQRDRHRNQKDRRFSVAPREAAAPVEDEEDEFGPGGSGADAASELEFPWHCPHCTCFNGADRLICEACGILNKRRERLRERVEQERLLLLARQRKEEANVVDRMRDLDDLNDEDEDDEMEVIVLEGEDESDDECRIIASSPPTTKVAARAKSKSPGAAAAPPSVPAPRRPLEYLAPRLINGQGPLALLPADLLLHCVAFLGDARAYVGLRTLSKAWSRLAEHESLWRPLAEACCRPKEKAQQPKVKTQARAAEAEASASASSTAEAEAVRRASLPSSWSCKACGLLQADRFGIQCEFCSVQRDIITSLPPAPGATAAQEDEAGEAGEGQGGSCFRVIKTYDELAEAWKRAGGKAGGGQEQGQQEQQQQQQLSAVEKRPLWSEEKKRQADEAALAASNRLMAGGCEHERWHLAGAGQSNAWDLAVRTGEFYFVRKAQALDEALSAKWDSLHRGYEWLVNSARAALRTRLYSSREEVNQRDDSLIAIPESFQKVVNKLTRRDWPLLWECMRAEFALQAEALRRDIVRHLAAQQQRQQQAQAQEEGSPAFGPLRGYRAFLGDLLRCFQIWQKWAYEISAYFMKLNDQISGERFRATTSTLHGCGVREAASVPYVSELALLAFRDHVLQHFAVRTALMGAIEGDPSLSLTAVLSCCGAPASSASASAAAGAAGGGSGGVGVGRQDDGLVEPEESEVDRRVLAHKLPPVAADASRDGQRRRLVENLADLIVSMGKMVEELDVTDNQDSASGVSFGDAYRRTILRPVRDTLAEMRVDGVGGMGRLGDGKGEMEDEEDEGMVEAGLLREEGDLCGGGGGGGGRGAGGRHGTDDDRFLQLSNSCRGFRRLKGRDHGAGGGGGGGPPKRMRLV